MKQYPGRNILFFSLNNFQIPGFPVRPEPENGFSYLTEVTLPCCPGIFVPTYSCPNSGWRKFRYLNFFQNQTSHHPDIFAQGMVNRPIHQIQRSIAQKFNRLLNIDFFAAGKCIIKVSFLIIQPAVFLFISCSCAELFYSL